MSHKPYNSLKGQMYWYMFKMQLECRFSAYLVIWFWCCFIENHFNSKRKFFVPQSVKPPYIMADRCKVQHTAPAQALRNSLKHIPVLYIHSWSPLAVKDLIKQNTILCLCCIFYRVLAIFFSILARLLLLFSVCKNALCLPKCIL